MAGVPDCVFLFQTDRWDSFFDTCVPQKTLFSLHSRRVLVQEIDAATAADGWDGVEALRAALHAMSTKPHRARTVYLSVPDHFFEASSVEDVVRLLTTMPDIEDLFLDFKSPTNAHVHIGRALAHVPNIWRWPGEVLLESKDDIGEDADGNDRDWIPRLHDLDLTLSGRGQVYEDRNIGCMRRVVLVGGNPTYLGTTV
jgi:hypothetical protein